MITTKQEKDGTLLLWEKGDVKHSFSQVELKRLCSKSYKEIIRFLFNGD